MSIAIENMGIIREKYKHITRKTNNEKYFLIKSSYNFFHNYILPITLIHFKVGK